MGASPPLKGTAGDDLIIGLLCAFILFVNLIITSVRLFRFAFSFLGMFECQITCLQTLATTLIICKHKGLILCVNTYVCMFDCAMQ